MARDQSDNTDRNELSTLIYSSPKVTTVRDIMLASTVRGLFVSTRSDVHLLHYYQSGTWGRWPNITRCRVAVNFTNC